MNNAEKRAVVVFPGWGDDALHGIRLALLLASLQTRDTVYYCLPFGWKVATTRKQVQVRFQELTETEMPKIVSSHKETSLIGVSTGASLALLYALQHPSQIASVVAYCGCIQYDKSYFETIPHEGFEYAVKKLNIEMKKNPRKTDGLAKKTMIVTPAHDEIIPLELQHLAGAAETVQIGYPLHLLATVPGLVYHLAQGERSEITKWLIKGPLQQVSEN